MNESAADRQAAQQTEQQEKKYGDSSTAVSNDTQFADPRQGSDGASFKDEGASVDEATQGGASRGESTVFGEPGESGETGDAADEDDQDAEPPTPTQEEPPLTSSGGDTAQTSYGEDQDAEPSQPPYEQ
ncbi:MULTISPECIES: hypothetical protein [Nocardioides]|uniref:Uncharacterized protein n=1 Tax=Nocardioides vastitatis TaxID=2568655 RepID=A0ABW0ZPI2_9ACTN|nr:hypothetical protein [Nocardioides sp.]THJ08436.1 hypothetical protein E7Z54_04405 [Nocardioides sp.]